MTRTRQQQQQLSSRTGHAQQTERDSKRSTAQSPGWSPGSIAWSLGRVSRKCWGEDTRQRTSGKDMKMLRLQGRSEV
eukprot:1142675-Pelagomonas_calceolata.AAC.7